MSGFACGPDVQARSSLSGHQASFIRCRDPLFRCLFCTGQRSFSGDNICRITCHCSDQTRWMRIDPLAWLHLWSRPTQLETMRLAALRLRIASEGCGKVAVEPGPRKCSDMPR